MCEREEVHLYQSIQFWDHDIQSKESLTPSVVLDVNIPSDIPDSFYRGQI